METSVLERDVDVLFRAGLAGAVASTSRHRSHVAEHHLVRANDAFSWRYCQPLAHGVYDEPSCPPAALAPFLSLALRQARPEMEFWRCRPKLAKQVTVQIAANDLHVELHYKSEELNSVEK